MARVIQLNTTAYQEYLAAQDPSTNVAEGDISNEVDTRDGMDGVEEHATLFSQINRIYDGSRTAFNYSTLQCGYRVS